MKNLEICNLKELSSLELKSVEGGSSVGTWAGRILGFAFITFLNNSIFIENLKI